MKEIKIDKGLIVKKLNLEEDDVLIASMDLDLYSTEDMAQVYINLKKSFPNNEVIVICNTIPVERAKIIKGEDGWKINPL